MTTNTRVTTNARVATSGLSTIVRQQPSEIQRLLEHARDPDHALHIADPRAFLKTCRPALQVMPTPRQLEKMIDTLIAAKSWGSKSLEERPDHVELIHEAVRRHNIGLLVLAEAVIQLIDTGDQFVPTPSVVLDMCRKVNKAIERVLNDAKRVCDAIDAKEREFQRRLEAELQEAEDEDNPEADHQRWLAERRRKRPFERQQRVQEAMEVVKEFERKLDYLARGLGPRLPQVSRERKRMEWERGLGLARDELTAAQKLLAEDSPQ